MATEYTLRVDNVVTVKGDDGTGKKSSKEEIRDRSASSQIGSTIAIQMAKQATQFVVSNYGDLTGDYIQQKNIQGAIEIGGMALMAIKGGVVGVAMAIGTLAVKVAQRSIEIERANRSIALLRERTGMIGWSGGRV
ncbi:MAG: hypothetical protein M0R51_16005 [Clostridia bacterium]|jgi:hypothetical protein|nr:hypothetical protein [Clostridia bacterium]